MYCVELVGNFLEAHGIVCIQRLTLLGLKYTVYQNKTGVSQRHRGYRKTRICWRDKEVYIYIYRHRVLRELVGIHRGFVRVR